MVAWIVVGPVSFCWPEPKKLAWMVYCPAIARRLNNAPSLEAREVIGAELVELSIRQASDLIDHLKGAGAGRQRRMISAAGKNLILSNKQVNQP